ncbi:MAG: hypothetical protein JWR01_1179 [Subtercola sp.]|nr:hypothetical protein [Subtercola sp.]
MSLLRKTVVSCGVVAASLLFAVGGTTTAHAEMDAGEAPTQAETDWVPGSAGTYSTGTGSAGSGPWVAGDYRYSMTNYAGYDFWARADGTAPHPDDAANLGTNMNYSGGCVVPWWTERVMCHD